MTRTLRRPLAFVLICLLIAACATSPTGRRQLMLVSEDTAIASSAQAYVQEVGKLKQEGKLSDDRALIRRVNGITGKLVAQAISMRPDSADWAWSVAVIDDPETVNAWCMAGGRMAVYTGLFEKLKLSDDEFAQIMGHEISHALANHTAERMSRAMATSIGVLAVGVASDKPAVTMAGAAVAAKLALELPNSRTAESEADRIGIELATRAGYDPDAAASLWDKMGKQSNGAPPEFLSTHPVTTNRIAEATSRAEAYPAPEGSRIALGTFTVTGGTADFRVDGIEQLDRSNGSLAFSMSRFRRGLIAIPIGTVVQLDLIWLIADTLNAFMAIPNLVALLLLLLSILLAAQTLSFAHEVTHLSDGDTELCEMCRIQGNSPAVISLDQTAVPQGLSAHHPHQLDSHISSTCRMAGFHSRAPPPFLR